MTEKTEKKRYLGRVEIFAAREEIKALLEAGYSYTMIFDKLTREKRLSIAYRQFCRCLVQYCGVKPRIQKNSRKEATEQPTQANAPATPAQGQAGQKRKCIIASEERKKDDDGPIVGRSGKIYASRKDVRFGDWPEPDWLKEMKA